MATLNQRLLQLSRTLRRDRRKPLAWRPLLAFLGALCALEFCGRFSPNDFVDSFSVVGLALLLSSVWTHSSRRTRARWRLASMRLRQRLTPMIPRVGLDLRGEPALNHELPPLFGGLLLSIAVLGLCLESCLGWWPSDARLWLRSVSGLGYLVVLAALWSALIAGTLFFFLVQIAYLDARLAALRQWQPQRPRLNPRIGVAAFLGLSAAAEWLPATWALALLGGSYLLFVGALCLCPYSHIRLAWSPRDQPLSLRALPWRTSNALGGLCVVVAIASLATLACGDRLFGNGSEDTLLTSLLGLAFTWTASVATSWFLCLQAFEIVIHTLNDPARPARPRVAVRELPASQHATVSELLESLGMRPKLRSRTSWLRRGSAVRPSGEAEASTIDAELLWRPDSIPGIPDSYPPPPAWPRPFGHSDAASPKALAELKHALLRRADIVHRRRIRKGLTEALKQAIGRPHETGSGYWIAPHLWFLYHLTRDTDEEGQWFLGRPYRKLIPRPARHHLYQVLRSVQIDLIFLEDGVGHRGLLRVLAQLFEFYDLFGERALEERHFQGLPGLSVWIHQIPDRPPWSVQSTEPGEEDAQAHYPEPDYSEIGRARILHIFKDRGGDKQLDDVPFDWSQFPVPHELMPL